MKEAPRFPQGLPMNRLRRLPLKLTFKPILHTNTGETKNRFTYHGTFTQIPAIQNTPTTDIYVPHISLLQKTGYLYLRLILRHGHTGRHPLITRFALRMFP
jgi:hypothetical protein